MKKLVNGTPSSYYYTFIVVLLTISTKFLHTTNAQACNPGQPLIGTGGGQCNPNTANCCEAGQSYTTYDCSPPVTAQTQAVLTLNNFDEGGDGGGPSKCDGSYHSGNTLVVALSTGWYNGGSRCSKEIIIHGNGRTTRAKVVDECDSRNGCDEEHGYQVPCESNVVDASKAVWSALGVPEDSEQYGQMQITWSLSD
ncbi:putative ripening-related protein 1 [Chenopodium quinoa]|uniref:Uncharacterized protein n=1 Tax=Chenopodium quinoa TaxID=63459 RepID=A0A803M2U7_CHEQI|nr:putative ripening-related protein 1 [Chenopodium quinoa]